MKSKKDKKPKGFYSVFMLPEQQLGQNWSLSDMDRFLEIFKQENGVLPNVIEMKFPDYCCFTLLFNPHPEFLGKHYFSYRGIIIRYI